MNKLTAEHGILDAALEAIHIETDLRLKILKRDVKQGNRRVDAIIQLPNNGAKLTVDVKKWATKANVGAIINQINNLAAQGHGLLVTYYVNPNMGERLKDAGIQYIDTAGNAYINHQNVYVYVKGNKPQQAAAVKQAARTDKAFQPTGMKVVFAFLTNETLINAPYREIATHADVALGAVGWVIRDLIAQGFILEGATRDQRKLNDQEHLLDKWVENYPHKLKEKHEIGVFTTDNADWWNEIDITEFDALWGGEIAAAKYTNYLNPKHGVVYINKNNAAKLLQAARLRKPERKQVPGIKIELIEPFWTKENLKQTTQQQGLAHPIITYADLIETGNARNLDAANKLREQYLR